MRLNVSWEKNLVYNECNQGNSYIGTENCLTLHRKNKSNIITKYVYCKVIRRFSIYTLGKTWLNRILIASLKSPSNAGFIYLKMLTLFICILQQRI